MKTIAAVCIQLCAISIAIILTTSFASAKTWECGERSNLPQEGKDYCAAGDFRQAETKLHKVLNALLALHKTRYGNADSLNASQTAFDFYRNHQCIAENRRITDKPYHPMIVSQCNTRLTNLRIVELEQMQTNNP